MARCFFAALLLAFAVIAGLAPGSATAAPVSYTLPDETAAFKPGPNLEVVQNNCTGCHSAVYGAPIDDADIGRIVDYLAATY